MPAEVQAEPLEWRSATSRPLSLAARMRPASKLRAPRASGGRREWGLASLSRLRSGQLDCQLLVRGGKRRVRWHRPRAWPIPSRSGLVAGQQLDARAAKSRTGPLRCASADGVVDLPRSPASEDPVIGQRRLRQPHGWRAGRVPSAGRGRGSHCWRPRDRRGFRRVTAGPPGGRRRSPGPS